MSWLLEHLRAWVRQTIVDLEERCKAFTISTVQERVSIMDAPTNAFEDQVQKMLAEADYKIYQPYKRRLKNLGPTLLLH